MPGKPSIIDYLLTPLKLLHIVILILISVTAPAVSYMKFKGAVETRFKAAELNTEKEFAKKSDLKEIQKTQMKMIQLLHEVKGEMKRIHSEH